MKLKVCLVWMALNIIFPVTASSNPSDRVPRQWTEMSFADIDVTPFSWASPWGGGERNSRCKPGSSGLWKGATRCNLTLYRGGVSLPVVLEWMEQEPAEDCKARLARMCSRGRDRVALVFPLYRSGVDYLREADEVRVQSFPLDWVRPILDDLLARIELYAIPCSCGGVPVVPAAPSTSVTRSPAPATPAGRSSNPPWQLPSAGPGLDVPGLLGQGEGGPGTTSGGSRAMRRDSGGFPPGVKVTSLKFFQSSGEAVERGARSYDNRFSDRAEYINFELNLAYPAREERFPFEVTAVISKDGSRFATFTQDGLSLEPGWITSYHNGGWGRVGGGIWKPGSYRVELSVKGEVVATGTFQVVASER